MNENEVSFHDLVKEAKQAEANADLKKAAELYENILTDDVYNINVYNRLMIVYGKQKLFKDELRIINKGIKNITQLHASQQKKIKNKTIASLSKLLMKSTGLTDKKGNSVYQPEPIAKWKKRKESVEKKISKSK